MACSASNREGSSFESYAWRAVPSHLSHHSQDVLLAQFSLGYMCTKVVLTPIHFILISKQGWDFVFPDRWFNLTRIEDKSLWVSCYLLYAVCNSRVCVKCCTRAVPLYSCRILSDVQDYCMSPLGARNHYFIHIK